MLMDEFAKNPVEGRQMVKVGHEYPVFFNANSTLRGQLLVLFAKAPASDYCPDTPAPNGL